MASQPTFDLHGPGRADSSAMDFFAARGYDTWCLDLEGYGRSTKTRDNNAPITYGADDCFAATSYIQKLRGDRPLLVYGISSGALRGALFAQRHPKMVARLALDAMVWTGEGSPTLAERRKRLSEFRGSNRRPIDRKFFELLPNPDKQFAVMPGIAHASFHQKNYAICYHILESFFSQPAPIYRGGH